jgi:hypothetical protein
MSTSFSIGRPCGHLVKIKLADAPDKFGNGLIEKPQWTKDQDQYATCEAYVLELGFQAYGVFGVGENASIPWCKVGDHVLIRKYAAMRQEGDVADEDKLYRLIKDEDICMVFEHERKN